MSELNRRSALLAAALAAAAFAPRFALAQVQEVDPQELYRQVRGEPFPVKAVDVNRLNPRYLRSLVEYPTDQPPGTIIVDPAKHFLYLVLGDGQAVRYGVGVGREGFSWSGSAEIGAKREWPDWYPPKEMFARQPEIVSAMSKLQSGLGMHGGPDNPLGARAMYLYKDGKDTLFRIHGTIEPYTIGKNVSSGCIRMMNQDVLDLYSRVGVGTKVVVLGDAQPYNEEASQRPGSRRHVTKPSAEDVQDVGVPADPQPIYEEDTLPSDPDR